MGKCIGGEKVPSFRDLYNNPDSEEEDNLHYEQIEPTEITEIMENSTIICARARDGYIEIICQRVSLFHSIHIETPGSIKATAWYAGPEGKKYIIKPNYWK